MTGINRGRPKLLPVESSEWVLAAARGGRLRARLVARRRAQRGVHGMRVAGVRVEGRECMRSGWCSGEEPEGGGLGGSSVAVVRHYDIRSSGPDRI